MDVELTIDNSGVARGSFIQMKNLIDTFNKRLCDRMDALERSNRDLIRENIALLERVAQLETKVTK